MRDISKNSKRQNYISPLTYAMFKKFMKKLKNLGQKTMFFHPKNT